MITREPVTNAAPLAAIHNADRLTTLSRTGLLDAGPDESLDRLTRLATRVLRVPIALVSLVAAERQYLAGAAGLPEPYATVRETPLAYSFCQHVVLSREPLIVTDSRNDPRVREIPVIEGLPVVGYAGFPLVTDEGYVLGTFCAIDDKPRSWSDAELEGLSDLASAASTEIRLRLAIAEVRAELAAREAAEAALEQVRATETEERRAAEQRQQEFLDDIAHDLRNPLAAIKGQAQLMLRQLDRKGAVAPERLRSGLHGIQIGVEQMSAQIAELQDVALLRSGQPLALTTVPMNLVALVNDTVEIARQLSSGHEIVVEADVPELIGRWDQLRLRRVFDNILGNAVKFSPGGGQVSVVVARHEHPDGPWARIDVRDEGVGIPAADLDRIFERFQRGSNVTGRIRGTGIGLAGARQIVGQHGGSITVSSEEGSGTTVTVSLPLRYPA